MSRMLTDDEVRLAVVMNDAVEAVREVAISGTVRTFSLYMTAVQMGMRFGVDHSAEASALLDLIAKKMPTKNREALAASSHQLADLLPGGTWSLEDFPSPVVSAMDHFLFRENEDDTDEVAVEAPVAEDS